MASTIGLVGLAVMGQNLALNVAEKGFPISVYNRSGDKTDAAVARAQKEGVGRGGARDGGADGVRGLPWRAGADDRLSAGGRGLAPRRPPPPPALT